MAQINGIETGGRHNGTVFLLNQLILLCIVDGSGRAHPGTNTTLAFLQHIAVVRVDGCHLGHGLGKGNVNGPAGIQPQIEFVRNLFLGTLLGTQAAAGAFGCIYKTSLLADGHLEIAHKSLHRRHLRVGVDVDFLILGTVHHLWCQNAGSAVQGWEGLINLGHLAANGGLLFHNVHLKACIRNIQCGLDSGNAAADDQRTLFHRTGSGLQGRIQHNLCNGSSAQDDGLFRSLRFILMNPRALLSDVGNLYHIGIQASLFTGFAEGVFVHSGRTGTHHNTSKTKLTHLLLNQILAGLGAHILIICGEHNAGFLAECLRNRLHVHRCCNVTAAPADKNAYLLHCVPPYRLYLRKALVMACCGISASRSAGICSGVR